MKTNFNIHTIILALIATLFATGPLLAQDARSLLFKEARKAYQNAMDKQAELLSPSYFDQGVEHFEDASAAYDNNGDLDNIKKDLQESIKYFQMSVKEIDVLEVLFAETMNARSDALDARANIYQEEMWTEADETFRDAAHAYEKGNADNAKEEGKEAEDLFRKAELAAIKSNLFNNAEKLIAQAEEVKADKVAPKTYALAVQSLEDGKKYLEEARYDTDRPRMLAKKAEYEARHAIYLTQAINDFDDSDRTVEDLYLTTESYLKGVGNTIGMDPKFDEGSAHARDMIVARLNEINDSLSRMTHNLANCERLAANQEAQIALYSEQIENLSTEAAAKQELLMQQMAYEKQVEEKFNKIFQMFGEDEAEVFRQGNDIILRMTGFDFDVGSAEIKPENYPVLSKVQEAIRIFPDNHIVIQGHTDSRGSDTLNMTLSEKRARAVEAYLIANMPDYDQSNISSVGYGETKPIANNETKYGRSENRRIDVVIEVENL